MLAHLSGQPSSLPLCCRLYERREYVSCSPTGYQYLEYCLDRYCLVLPGIDIFLNSEYGLRDENWYDDAAIRDAEGRCCGSAYR